MFTGRIKKIRRSRNSRIVWEKEKVDGMKLPEFDTTTRTKGCVNPKLKKKHRLSLKLLPLAYSCHYDVITIALFCISKLTSILSSTVEKGISMGWCDNTQDCFCDQRAKKALNAAFVLCSPKHEIHGKCCTKSRHKSTKVTCGWHNQFIVSILNNSKVPMTAVLLFFVEEEE